MAWRCSWPIRLDAGYWGLKLIAWIHTVLGARAVIPWNPKRQRRRDGLPPTWTAEELGKRTSIERFFGRVLIFFRLQRPPVFSWSAAVALIAELGTDMSRFPTHRHLASWAGVCRGNKQRGGKRLSGATTQGNPWLRAMLGEVAWAIAHTSGNYLSAPFHRLARRLGKQQAAMAVSQSVLVILYHMLRDYCPYTDLGADYFDHVDRQRIERHHIHRLEQLGYTVTLTPAPAA